MAKRQADEHRAATLRRMAARRGEKAAGFMTCDPAHVGLVVGDWAASWAREAWHYACLALEAETGEPCDPRPECDHKVCVNAWAGGEPGICNADLGLCVRCGAELGNGGALANDGPICTGCGEDEDEHGYNYSLDGKGWCEPCKKVVALTVEGDCIECGAVNPNGLNEGAEA